MKIPPLIQQPIEHVDCTPNAELAVRILRAYRERCNCKYEVEGLDSGAKRVCDMMNKYQVQRAAILDEAIATLEAVG